MSLSLDTFSQTNDSSSKKSSYKKSEFYKYEIELLEKNIREDLILYNKNSVRRYAITFIITFFITLFLIMQEAIPIQYMIMIGLISSISVIFLYGIIHLYIGQNDTEKASIISRDNKKNYLKLVIRDIEECEIEIEKLKKEVEYLSNYKAQYLELLDRDLEMHIDE